MRSDCSVHITALNLLLTYIVAFLLKATVIMSGVESFFIVGTIADVFASIFAVLELVIQHIRRPIDLFDLYGLSGIFLYLFGSRTTWSVEAHVLGIVSDDDALNFKKCVQDECTMISVAVRSFIQKVAGS